MKLTELMENQEIIIQLLMGEQTVEFSARLIERGDKGVYVTPYLYQNQPLELNVTYSSKAMCNIFADDEDKNRVSWRNVELTTVSRDDKLQYYIETSSFNTISNSDERRTHDRIKIHKNGSLYDASTNKYHDIMIHDVSDVGISFYAPANFKPSSHKLSVLLDDMVNNKEYSVKVECSIVRNDIRNGLGFFACKTVGDNKDYALYCFIKKLTTK